ncbi:MAG: hypothetical protein JST54_18615 [Deltaproteobacteria bacterium]|nr:hypothetical protein [Deltaproteobacteria bacterium]
MIKAIAFTVGLALFSTTARAEKVKLDVKVVEASKQGNTIDPRVAHLHGDLAHLGVAFTSYKLISEASPVVDAKASTEVGLPEGRKLILSPQGRDKDGKIGMHIEVPGLFNENYSVADGKRHTVSAGAIGHGTPTESQVFVVITHNVQK